jgi:D-galactarolactone isomerase
MSADDYARLDPILQQIRVPIVIDHFGRIPFPNPLQTEQYRRMRRLLDTGRCWVKLSAPYSDSVAGWPDFTDVTPLAQDLIRHAPERVLWAANWPFVDLPDGPKPDPLDMLNLLAAWAPDAAARHRILVENPEAVYGFDPKDRPKAPARAG